MSRPSFRRFESSEGSPPITSGRAGAQLIGARHPERQETSQALVVRIAPVGRRMAAQSQTAVSYGAGQRLLLRDGLRLCHEKVEPLAVLLDVAPIARPLGAVGAKGAHDMTLGPLRNLLKDTLQVEGVDHASHRSRVAGALRRHMLARHRTGFSTASAPRHDRSARSAHQSDPNLTQRPYGKGWVERLLPFRRHGGWAAPSSPSRFGLVKRWSVPGSNR